MAAWTPEHVGPRTRPNRKSPWATVEEQRAALQQAVQAQLQVLRSQLGAIVSRFAAIDDPRRAHSVQHPLPTVLLHGMLLFVFQFASRRKGNEGLSCPAMRAALAEVLPACESTPHTDTVDRLLQRIPADEIESVPRRHVRGLMRQGKLNHLKVQGRYVVAVDGTQKWSRSWPWAEEALRRCKPGSEEVQTYSAYALEATLVGPQGVRLPISTEFCANEPQPPKSDEGVRAPSVERQKQDCEFKAFKRLAPRLKATLRRQPLLIVADGLYANGPAMDICRTHGWDFMLVLRDGSLPLLWEEANKLRKLEPGNIYHTRWGNREQHFWWVNDLVHEFGHGQRIKVHLVVCEEIWTEFDRDNQPVSRKARFAWVSGSPLTAKNAVDRCNRAARHRWDIEEHILAEKHHGYQCSHAFSLDWNAMRGWHHLMQLAELLNTLVLHNIHLWDDWVCRFGFAGTIDWLRTAYLSTTLDLSCLRALLTKPPQLRLVF